MDLVQNKHIQAITDILRRVGERVEGNLMCDIDPDNWVYHRNQDKIHNLQQLAKSKGKRKILEIGINACHSLVLMLLENPTAEYLLFDLNNHRYTEPTLQYVREAFPDTKITAIFGDSTKTIARYIADRAEERGTYDLCHLDGGHTEDVFSQDYANVRELVREGACVIFDDYDLPDIHRFVNARCVEGAIQDWIGAEQQLRRTPYHFLYRYAACLRDDRAPFVEKAVQFQQNRS